jgi:hypothetical protein
MRSPSSARLQQRLRPTRHSQVGTQRLFRSRCKMGGSWACKYSMPRAAPMACAMAAFLFSNQAEGGFGRTHTDSTASRHMFGRALPQLAEKHCYPGCLTAAASPRRTICNRVPQSRAECSSGEPLASCSKSDRDPAHASTRSIIRCIIAPGNSANCMHHLAALEGLLLSCASKDGEAVPSKFDGLVGQHSPQAGCSAHGSRIRRGLLLLEQGTTLTPGAVFRHQAWRGDNYPDKACNNIPQA